MIDEDQGARPVSRQHRTILAALRFSRTTVLAPDMPSPDRVLVGALSVAATAAAPLSLPEAGALIRRMDGPRIGVAPPSRRGSGPRS
jgi:hypothetical protein